MTIFDTPRLDIETEARISNTVAKVMTNIAQAESNKPVHVGDLVHVFRDGKCSEHRVTVATYDPCAGTIGVDGIGERVRQDCVTWLDTEACWHSPHSCQRTREKALTALAEAKRQLVVLERSNKQLVEQVRILQEAAGSRQEAA